MTKIKVLVNQSEYSIRWTNHFQKRKLSGRFYLFPLLGTQTTLCNQNENYGRKRLSTRDLASSKNPRKNCSDCSSSVALRRANVIKRGQLLWYACMWFNSSFKKTNRINTIMRNMTATQNQLVGFRRLPHQRRCQKWVVLIMLLFATTSSYNFNPLDRSSEVLQNGSCRSSTSRVTTQSKKLLLLPNLAKRFEVRRFLFSRWWYLSR